MRGEPKVHAFHKNILDANCWNSLSLLPVPTELALNP